MSDRIDDFLKENCPENEDTPSKWDEVIKPEASYLLTGDVGTGKSALAHHLLEKYGKKYSLTPTLVGIPPSKQTLLPEGYQFLNDKSKIAFAENSIVLIDEADIQLPLDSKKDKETVINFLSLPRQRNQILILAYHFPRLVKGTYLPFFSGFLFKRPPYLLEFAAKKGSDELMGMMKKAGERFDEMTNNEEILKNTYVVAPRIRWQGLLTNELPSFWSAELSKVWKGTAVDEEFKGLEQVEQDQLPIDEKYKKLLTTAGEENPFWHSTEELRKMCAEKGLKTTGTKRELVARYLGLKSLPI